MPSESQACRDGDSLTLSPAMLPRIAVAARKAGVRYLWLDAWCHRFEGQPPPQKGLTDQPTCVLILPRECAGEYEHSAFCSTLTAVTSLASAVLMSHE